MSIVAIEINPNRILLVAGRKSTGRPLVVSHAIEIPLEADLSDEAIGEQLKVAVQDRNLNRSEAIVILSRSQSELREIELPPSPDDELPDMVMFKAKTDFASFDDRWILDFVSLDDDESLPRRVLASAISPNVSERIEKIIEPTGLKLTRMVLRPFAIMDLLQEKTSDSIARLVVNPGDQFTDIVVAKGNQTISTRSIRMSANHSADQRSQLLLSEVRRTLATAKRQLDGAQVESVVLLDDEKTNRHLVGNLRERLKIEVEIVDPMAGLKRTGQAKGDLSSPWQYSPLLGTLLTFDSDQGPPIDFLNPSRRQEVVTDNSRWWIYGSLAGLAALMAFVFGWWTLSSQTAEIAQLEKDLVAALESNETQQIDAILGRTAVIDKWQKANVHWLNEIDELSTRFLTADEAIVSNFNAAIRRNKPSIEVFGRVASNEEDSKLFQSLEARPYTVDLTKSDVGEGDADYPYTFGKSLSFPTEGSQWLAEIDKHVDQFHKSRHADRSEDGSVN